MDVLQQVFPFSIPFIPPIEVLARHKDGVSLATWERHIYIHHQGYVDTLNQVMQTPQVAHLKGMPAGALRTLTPIGSPFSNALFQHINHAWAWESLGTRVHLLPLFPPVLDRLISDLNLTKVEFLRAGVEAAQRHFGSGWLWLILERGQLMWETTSDAAQPRKAPDRKILLVVDLWEHAFLPDLAGKRADWVRFCLRATNWDVVAHRV